MAVNVKMGVDIGGFTSGIREGQQILKGLNAEMKAADAEFKATGNAQQKMNQQTKTLNSQLNVQKGIVDQAQKALKRMEEAGIKPTDAAYQKMYATMMNAKAGMNEAQAQLNNLGTGAETAAGKTDKLAQSMNGLNKKVSLEQIIGGIGKITDGLENAARKAAQVAQSIFNSILDTAQWSDDTATQARFLDMSIERYQQYKGVFDTVAEMTVSDWTKAKRKVEKAITDPSNDQIDALRALGFTEMIGGKFGREEVVRISDNWEQAFWDAADALTKKVKNGEISLEQADMLGEALFGKNYSSMKALIDMGQAGFQEALDNQNVASEEAVQKNAELNDKIIDLNNSFNALKVEVSSGLAPALKGAAEALNGMLTSLLEYLKTDDGKKMLSDLGTAVSGLFSDLSNIDPAQVVEGFTSVMGTVVEKVQWLFDNKDGVVQALKTIIEGWAGLKLIGGALDVLKLINGITGLTGGAGVASAAGKAAGEAWGGGFAAAVMKAAPWLVGLYTLLNPAETANNDVDLLFDEKTKKLTKAGEEAGITMTYDEYMGWKSSMHEPMYSAEGQAAFLWENQLLEGNAWVRVTKAQYDAVQQFYDYFRNMGPEEDISDVDWNAFEQAFAGQEDLFDLVNEIFDHFTQTSEGKLQEDLPEDFFKVTVEPEVPENAAEDISQKIGTVKVGVDFLLNGGGHSLPGLPGFANGISYVPYDGFLANLHKGERVVPAREVASRSYSSNLYVENMNMSGGADAAGLAAAMAAAQRRTMSAYGS